MLKSNPICPLFANATNFSLVTPSSLELGDPEPIGKDGADGTVVILASVATVSVTAILTAIFVFVRLMSRHNGGSTRTSASDFKEVSVFEPRDHEAIKEIGVGPDNDISTLGDPPGMSYRFKDEPQETSTNATFSLAYDYQKKVNPNSVADNETLKSTVFVAEDDDTLEAQYVTGEQFDVYAPAGFLGFVLGSNADGFPVVTHVKDTSVLNDSVQPGDRLIAVDGVDVVLMHTTDISQMIASKQNQEERHLLFSRPVNRKQRSFSSLARR